MYSFPSLPLFIRLFIFFIFSSSDLFAKDTVNLKINHKFAVKRSKTSTKELKKLTIAIDGFSSCGKSTMAKDLAREVGYIYIDSGAMYRPVSLFSRNDI